jgi:enoyl-CoA hydratase
MSETIIVETHGRVGLIRLNRPQALNALNSALIRELAAAIDKFETDDNIGCIVITGSDKAFAAGADIKEMADKAFTDVFLGDFAATWHRVAEARKPVIAAVAGFALGGGCEMALCCSIRIASKTAKLGQPEVKLGIIPGYGGSQRLARLCGKGVAHELCLTGEMISAEEAQRVGLVNHVYEPAELLPAAETMAKKIIEKAPLAVKYCMEAIERGVEMPLEEGLFLEATLFGLCCATADMREGTKAFLEKRAAHFKGN